MGLMYRRPSGESSSSLSYFGVLIGGYSDYSWSGLFFQPIYLVLFYCFVDSIVFSPST